jgi:hypothetical protein
MLIPTTPYMTDEALLPSYSINREKYSEVNVPSILHLVEQRLYHRDINFNVVFMTVHGSHLYGFETENSDLDIYMVIDFYQPEYSHLNKKYVKQFIIENFKDTVDLDITVIGLNRWLQLVNEGAHQACEAFMSPYAYISEYYMPYRTGFTLPAQTVINRFMSTVEHFTLSGFNVPKNINAENFIEPPKNKRHVKQLRHAARLATHIADLRTSGSFIPTVSETVQKGFPNFETISFSDYTLWLNTVSGLEIFNTTKYNPNAI